jgi:hypothetical protein
MTDKSDGGVYAARGGAIRSKVRSMLYNIVISESLLCLDNSA